MRQVRVEVEGGDVVEQPWAVEVADGGQWRDFLGAFDDGGSQPPNVVNGHVECPHQRAGVLAEALLARDQAVAVVFVLHLALAVVVGEADIVVGRQKQTGALSFEPLGDRRDLFGGGFLFAEQMVETEHHERVGVGQHPFVDRELVTGLVDALEDRHWVPGGLLGQFLERQGGAVEEFQGARDALQEVRRVILRCLVARPQDVAHLGHGGEPVLHGGRITLCFPGIAPRPVDADAPPAGVRAGGVALVVGASVHDDDPFSCRVWRGSAAR